MSAKEDEEEEEEEEEKEEEKEVAAAAVSAHGGLGDAPTSGPGRVACSAGASPEATRAALILQQAPLARRRAVVRRTKQDINKPAAAPTVTIKNFYNAALKPSDAILPKTSSDKESL